MPRNLVLFDLEWNIGYKPYIFNYHGVQQTFRGEIIEIGAVKIDEDANVLDTFSIHLRPRIFRTLQHHIAKVTGLTQADLDRGEPIVQGLRRFMQWCGPDAEFAEWGMDDVPVLKQNLFLCNLDESRPTQWYDLQQIFLREHPRKEGEGMTLESVVTRMGIPMERPFHDALSDTLYTADVCRKLDLRAGLAAYPTEEESLRASLCPAPGDYRDFRVFRGYVEQSAWRSDPKIITASCPVCGGDLQPDDIWLKKGNSGWYTLSQCPICAGKGGHERIVPVDPLFFTHLHAYLSLERPRDGDGERVFVVLKGPNRGRPLTAAGLDEVLAGARRRAGLAHATCHELRHTCFTRLREAGMSLEAIQAQAGHANLDTTRLYLHLSNDWLADQYRDAMTVLADIYDNNGAVS